jgi:hypothetical protein
MKRLKLNWEMWVYNLAADSIRGGANAVTTSGIVTAMDPQKFAEIHKFCLLVLYVFVTHAVLNLSHYLETSPLPPVEQDPSALASGPDAKV